MFVLVCLLVVENKLAKKSSPKLTTLLLLETDSKSDSESLSEMSLVSQKSAKNGFLHDFKFGIEGLDFLGGNLGSKSNETTRELAVLDTFEAVLGSRKILLVAFKLVRKSFFKDCFAVSAEVLTL